MTETIQKSLCRGEVLKHNLPCENVKYLFSDWECDVLSIKKSDYLTEFEVKISRSDFLADKKKSKWWHYENGSRHLSPNYFYYACPEGLILPDEIPAFAGLVYVDGETITEIKRAPFIHRYKYSRDKILTKFMRVMSERSYLGCCRLTYKNNKINNANLITE